MFALLFCLVCDCCLEFVLCFALDSVLLLFGLRVYWLQFNLCCLFLVVALLVSSSFCVLCGFVVFCGFVALGWVRFVRFVVVVGGLWGVLRWCVLTLIGWLVTGWLLAHFAYGVYFGFLWVLGG